MPAFGDYDYRANMIKCAVNEYFGGEFMRWFWRGNEKSSPELEAIRQLTEQNNLLVDQCRELTEQAMLPQEISAFGLRTQEASKQNLI